MTILLSLVVLAPVGMIILAIRDGFFRKPRVVARGNPADFGYDTSSTSSLFGNEYAGLLDNRGSTDASDSSSCTSSEGSSDGSGSSCDSGGDSGSSDSGGGGGD